MLRTLRAFLDKHAPPRVDNDDRRVRVATAAMLLEVTRVDHDVTEEERAAVMDAVKTKFGLSEDEAAELLSLALEAARQATDYFEFTRDINQTFSAEQKLKLIERLWNVAYADKDLHKYEDHLVRKVADLLYVPYQQVIAAKNRARDA
jgi:uncharacterized tellurite resistance protein B-like protein